MTVVNVHTREVKVPAVEAGALLDSLANREDRVWPAADGGSRFVHDLRMRTRGWARLSWPLVFRPLHDALVEDGFANAARTLGERAPDPGWSPWVKALRTVLERSLARRRRPAPTAG